MLLVYKKEKKTLRSV